MAVLAHRPLQNLAGQIFLRHILYFIEMTGGAIVCATEQVGLRGRMHEVFLWIRIGPIDHFPRIDFERGWRVGCVLDLLDQMAGGAADALDLWRAGQYLGHNLLDILREHSSRWHMTGETTPALVRRRIGLQPDTQHRAEDRRLQ